MNIATADGFIGGFEDDYHYSCRRPVTAIREGDLDARLRRVDSRFFSTDFVSSQTTSGEPFAGIHFTNATRAGLARGAQIGEHAFTTLLQPATR